VNTVTAIAIGMLALAGAINFARAVRRGTIVDRAVALDGLASAVICGIAIGAVRVGDGGLIDITLVGGLLGFLTLATVARFVGRRGL
jgi:multisubunit Na+/H+ antiporter MnhF subunit